MGESTMSEVKVDTESFSYNRHHDWVCGRTVRGNPCPLGPSGRGVCRVEKQCRPAWRGEQWVCTRCEEQGGPCDTGPGADGTCSCPAEKCTPVRSVRARRGVLALAATTVTVAVLIFGFGSPWRNELLAPGPLTQAHGQILNGSQRCAACHPAADASLSSWVASTYKSANPFDAAQTESCLKCHDKTIGVETATLAHTADSEQMHELTIAQTSTLNKTEPRSIPAHMQADIACSTCHREHHGDRDLSAMTDRQCQACHQNQFHSFDDGHPDFGDWPYTNDRGIAFDHAQHFVKFFRQAKKDIRCRDCHISDHGNVVAVADYKQTCAECHDGFLNQVDSVAFLSLPIIDPEAFATAELTVGDWPAEAIGDFDGQLPIFARVLLLADPRANEALQRLGYDFDFFDVQLDDKQQLQDAAQIAWSLKQLIYELSVEGHAAIKQRYERILDRELTTVELQAMTGYLPPIVFRTAQERWFPNLEQEVNQRTTTAQSIDGPAEVLGGKESVAFGGWFVDSEVCSIGYHPIGHNDELTRSWIELMAELRDKSESHDWDAEFSQSRLTIQCASCHINADERQWTAAEASDAIRGFTRFDHGPHLVLPELSDCVSCHGASWEASDAKEISDTNNYHSEFTAMNRASCAQCHTARAAGNACTTCHNYHVDHIR